LIFLEDTAKGAQHPPLLDPCLLWPRLPISATAELLFQLPSSVSLWHWTLHYLTVPETASVYSCRAKNW